MKKLATIEQSMSIDKAANSINVPTAVLTRLCKQDKQLKFHHLTAFSKHIRFTQDELQRVKKKI